MLDTGKVTYTVSNCEIYVEEPLEVSSDCNGEQTFVQGW